MADPERSSARNLAERYGLSIARTDAILRLKGLEAQWRKVSPHFAFVFPRDVARRMSSIRLVFKMPFRVDG